MHNPPATRIDPRGLAAAAGAFLIWGLMPLYLKQLDHVAVLQVAAHRLVWGCVVALAWLSIRGELTHVWAALSNSGVRWRLFASAMLISANWMTYIWGVSTNRIVETSLGYFINPLLNIVLGVVVLSERLTPAQWTAVAIAAVGVAYLTWASGQPPWIALVLALAFGLYGLVRKVVKVEALAGFASETLLLLPIGLAYLVWCELIGRGVLGHQDLRTDLLLALSGPFTAVPLVLFAFGARLIPYSTVGLMQYLAPTIQLLLAIVIYDEPFGGPRLIGFSLIWIALAIYAGEGVWRARKG